MHLVVKNIRCLSFNFTLTIVNELVILFGQPGSNIEKFNRLKLPLQLLLLYIKKQYRYRYCFFKRFQTLASKVHLSLPELHGKIKIFQ